MMEFQVKFETPIGCSVFGAIQFDSVPIGLKGVDQIRKYLRIPELKLSRISPIYPTKIENPCIKLPEHIARRSGHFEEKNFIRVRVSENGGLNKFCSKQVKYEKSSKTGELVEAWLEVVLNEDALLAAWEKAGFPLRWEL